MKGERGETGDKGDYGLKGESGEPGEKGIAGEFGYKGEKGLPGQPGPRVSDFEYWKLSFLFLQSNLESSQCISNNWEKCLQKISIRFRNTL